MRVMHVLSQLSYASVHYCITETKKSKYIFKIFCRGNCARENRIEEFGRGNDTGKGKGSGVYKILRNRTPIYHNFIL